MRRAWWQRCISVGRESTSLLLRLFRRGRRPITGVCVAPEAFDLKRLSTDIELQFERAAVHVFSNQTVEVAGQAKLFADLQSALNAAPEDRESAVRKLKPRWTAFDVDLYKNALGDAIATEARLGHVIQLRRTGNAEPVASVLVTAQTVQ